jgi:GT2 family glycosyltransferase
MDGPAQPAPRALAIVLNYKLVQETVACVHSLLQSNYAAMDVLVVDNGSGEESLQLLRASLGAQVQILALPDNRFYAGGMNAGLAWALERQADWFLVMNNDTLVDPRMVSHLLDTARTLRQVGAVAPLIYYASDPERVWSAGGRSRRFWPFPRDVARGGRLAPEAAEPLIVDYVTGCAMLLARHVVEKVGPFDPRYRMYYEDADLCERIRRAGYRIAVDPRAKLWHLVGRTAGQEPAVNRYHRTRNRWRFYLAHNRGAARLTAAALLLLQEGLRALWFLARGHRALARAQWRALRDGLAGAEGSYP